MVTGSSCAKRFVMEMVDSRKTVIPFMKKTLAGSYTMRQSATLTGCEIICALNAFHLHESCKESLVSNCDARADFFTGVSMCHIASSQKMQWETSSSDPDGPDVKLFCGNC